MVRSGLLPGSSESSRSLRSIVELDHDFSQSHSGGIVFPYAYHRPAVRSERFVYSLIPNSIAFELGSPIRLIHPRLPPMLRAPVPEASVNENRDSLFREHQVWPDADILRKNHLMFPEPIASSVKKRAQGNLGLGIKTPVAAHDC